jgi:crossover junction endodeoxyribonuclease RusA
MSDATQTWLLLGEQISAPDTGYIRFDRRTISFGVKGIPQQQGSKTARVYPPRDLRGTLQLILHSEQPHKTFVKCIKAGLFDANAKRLAKWRRNVTEEAIAAMREQQHSNPIEVACSVSVQFFFERPKHHYGTGKNSGKVKASARTFPSVKPDIDKLLRAVYDAITGVVISDDCRIVMSWATKTYTDSPGILVTVTAVEDERLEDLPPWEVSS